MFESELERPEPILPATLATWKMQADVVRVFKLASVGLQNGAGLDETAGPEFDGQRLADGVRYSGPAILVLSCAKRTYRR